MNRKVINRLLLEASSFLQRDDSTSTRRSSNSGNIIRRSKRLRSSKNISNSDSKGDRVEAKLEGWTKYYKGTITKENRDGTFNVLFDDGERFSKVDAKRIRSLETKSEKKPISKSKENKSSDDENSNGNKSKLHGRRGKKTKKT